VREQLYITFTPAPEKKLIVNQGSYVLTGQNITMIQALPFPSNQWQLITAQWQTIIASTWN
jgi:hypothetical protein